MTPFRDRSSVAGDRDCDGPVPAKTSIFIPSRDRRQAHEVIRSTLVS
jgi:hypothetical protein